MSWLDSFAGAGAAGGQSVGVAQGRIVIDTSSLAQARAVVLRESRIMGQALQTNIGAGAEKAADTAVSSFDSMTASLRSMKVAADVALLGITMQGIGASNRIKRLESLFVTLVGSQEKANEQMERLRDLADATNQPFLDVLEGANGIQPALRGTNADLLKTLTLVQRLAILDPAQGVQGSAFAIREFINGEYISLVRRLELDKSRLKDIIAESNGDIALQLDLLSDYVGELGLTEESMLALSNTGANAARVLRDEWTQTIATGLTPVTNAFNTVAAALADVLRGVRETNPELVKLLGTMTALYAVSQAPGLPGRFGFAVPGAGVIGKAGIGAAALYGGKELGMFGVRQAANLGTGGGIGEFEGKTQGEARGMLTETVKQVAVILVNAFVWVAKKVREAGVILGNAWNLIVTGIKQGAAYIGNAFASVVDVLGDAVGAIGNAMAGMLQTLEDDLKIDILGKEINPDLGLDSTIEDLRAFADSTKNAGSFLRTSDETMQAYADTVARGIGLTQSQKEALEADFAAMDGLTLNFADFLGLIDHGVPVMSALQQSFESVLGVVDRVLAVGQRGLPQGPTITDELLDEFAQYQQDIADVEAEYAQKRLDAIAQYEEQRGDIIADHERQMARDAEDEALRRERAEQDLAESISDARASMEEREIDQRESHADRMADLSEDFNEATQDAEAEHQKKLRDIQKSYRNQMIDAAMKLDGIAVYNAKRARDEQLSAEDERYSEEKQARDEQYQERIKEERAQHRERMDDLRRNGADQIASLRENFNKQERLRAEDRARTLARTREDHNRQLAELQMQHGRTLAELQSSLANERQALTNGWVQTYNQIQIDAGNHANAMVNIHAAGRTQIEADFMNWYNSWKPFTGVGQAVGAAQSAVNFASNFLQNLPFFANGGVMGRAGFAHMEAGEGAVPPRNTSAIMRMMGGQWSPDAITGAVAAGQANISNIVESLVLNTQSQAPQLSAYELQRIVETALTNKLSKLARV